MTDDSLRLACQTFLTVHPMGEAIEADWNMELTAEGFFPVLFFLLPSAEKLHMNATAMARKAAGISERPVNTLFQNCLPRQ